jgi:hypothetical protein
MVYWGITYCVENWLLGKKFNELQPPMKRNSEIKGAFHNQRHNFPFNLKRFHWALAPCCLHQVDAELSIKIISNNDATQKK